MHEENEKKKKRETERKSNTNKKTKETDERKEIQEERRKLFSIRRERLVGSSKRGSRFFRWDLRGHKNTEKSPLRKKQVWNIFLTLRQMQKKKAVRAQHQNKPQKYTAL